MISSVIDATMKKIITLTLCLIATTFLSHSVTAEPQNTSITNYPWAVLAYIGRMTNQELLALNYTFTDETLYSLEVSHQLSETNIVRRFFQPFITTVDVAGNVTYRDDPVGPIYEFIPYFDLRWANFPWNRYIATTIAVGEGISYVTQAPLVETENASNGETQNILNYLMLEITFALPKHPQWQLVARIHHRSGVFGLYNAENAGSSAVGLGVRYLF